MSCAQILKYKNYIGTRYSPIFAAVDLIVWKKKLHVCIFLLGSLSGTKSSLNNFGLLSNQTLSGFFDIRFFSELNSLQGDFFIRGTYL